VLEVPRGHQRFTRSRWDVIEGEGIGARMAAVMRERRGGVFVRRGLGASGERAGVD
jgi:hypothetical protein